jgi:hypothetical protein
MTVAPDPLPLAAALLGAAADVLPAGAAALLLLPLEQAATSTAAPTALPTPVASFAGVDIRLIKEFLIVFVSCLARWWSRQFPLPRRTVELGTGEVRTWIGCRGET